ncbi:UNVERIFIED_CONTAM: hypothetical protein Sindi_1647900 [Sesamum indicum]
MLGDAKIPELEQQLHQSQSQINEQVALGSQMEQKLTDITQKFQEAMATAEIDRRMALERGRQEGSTVCRKTGMPEGRLTYLQSDEHKEALTQPRLQGARNFMKAPAINDVVETKAADFMIMGFEK